MLNTMQKTAPLYVVLITIHFFLDDLLQIFSRNDDKAVASDVSPRLSHTELPKRGASSKLEKVLLEVSEMDDFTNYVLKRKMKIDPRITPVIIIHHEIFLTLEVHDVSQPALSQAQLGYHGVLTRWISFTISFRKTATKMSVKRWRRRPFSRETYRLPNYPMRWPSVWKKISA